MEGLKRSGQCGYERDIHACKFPLPGSDDATAESRPVLAMSDDLAGRQFMDIS